MKFFSIACIGTCVVLFLFAALSRYVPNNAEETTATSTTLSNVLSSSSSSFSSSSSSTCPIHSPSPPPPKLISLAKQERSRLRLRPNDLVTVNILVTGCAGYIASHFALALMQNTDPVTRYNIVGLDDLSRGDDRLIQRLHKQVQITNRHKFTFVKGSISDVPLVVRLLMDHRIILVVNFAGFAYASESVIYPLRYFDNTVTGTAKLLEAIRESVSLARAENNETKYDDDDGYEGVKRMVYSSSSAVYGEIQRPECDVPLTEQSPTNPTSPYGQSKLMAEQIIRAYQKSRVVDNDDFSFAILRYFNVIGADEQGRLGSLPRPSLIRYSRLVDACFHSAETGNPLSVYGSDYSTFDGSPVRDYIHVSDLVDAHIALINALHGRQTMTYNVGIGKGFSVNQIVKACTDVTGLPIPVSVGARRLGDPPLVLGDASLLRQHFNKRRQDESEGDEVVEWEPKYTDIRKIIETAWRWRQRVAKGDI